MTLTKPDPSKDLGISSLNLDAGEMAGGYLGLFTTPTLDVSLESSTEIDILPSMPLVPESPLGRSSFQHKPIGNGRVI